MNTENMGQLYLYYFVLEYESESNSQFRMENDCNGKEWS